MTLASKLRIPQINLCYKRNGKRHSCATIEIWMHFGGLLSTQEARVARGVAESNSYASFVLSNLPRAAITRWLHVYHFLNIHYNIRSKDTQNVPKIYFYKIFREKTNYINAKKELKNILISLNGTLNP